MKKAIFCLLAMLASIGPAGATVTTLHYWRMGENDPGAANRGSCTNTVDEAGGLTLTNSPILVQSVETYPIYTNNVSTIASNVDGSSLSLYYSSNQFGSAAPITGLSNNFGVELWVKPNDTGTTKSLVYNGSSGYTGWGLYQTETNFRAIFGGIAFFGSGQATTNVWTHLAMVINDGTAVFYVNGVESGSRLGVFNTVVAGDALRVAANIDGGELFAGGIDEVRIFTFATNQFSTNDLLYFSSNTASVFVPPPLSTPLLWNTFGSNYEQVQADFALDSRLVAQSYYLAMPFTPYATAPLGQVVISAYYVNGPDEIQFTLAQDSNGVPGSALETWSLDDLIFGLQTNDTNIRKMDSLVHPVLTNSVNYWLEASANDPNTEDWWIINPLDATIPIYSLSSTNQGTNWNAYAVRNCAFQVYAENPVITGIAPAGTNLTIYATNGLATHTYIALASTNLAQTLSLWKPAGTNVLSADGGFTVSVTNGFATSTRQQYYILQMK
jgi:hypothetical protein